MTEANSSTKKHFFIFNGLDKPVWKFNPNGDFLVSFAYWILFKEANNEFPYKWLKENWKRL